MPLTPVILSGGAGSRLWPVSRESHPKPFIRLADGQSLLQKTFLRAVALPGVQDVLTVTNREFLFKTEDDYREVDPARNPGTPATYVLEPFGRNTAAAVAAAALTLAERDPATVMLVLPADHLIADQAAFAEAVARAVALAERGLLVTFGIEPTAPETGFGYIEAEGTEDGAQGAAQSTMVKRFVEKPDADTARRFLETGGFYWNSGMFCFTAAALIGAMERHCPDILAAVGASLQGARRAKGAAYTQIELDATAFAQTREDSIDYAVMEKSDRVAVVPCRLGWSDIGSWTALGALLPADAEGNRIDGEALLHDVRDCSIHARERVVGAVGVDGLIVVDTADALLIAAKDRAQDVKQIYARLKQQGHQTYREHRTGHRPWGTYSVLEEGERFKIKRIVVKPGHSLSLQMHHHRSEHWVVVSGTAKIVNGSEERFVRTNESTFIPACTPHRLVNPGITELVLIEVQSGEYLGEDDIVRFDDRYGRVPDQAGPTATKPAA